MQRYDYRCDQCKIVFEDVRSVDDCAHAPCPFCDTIAYRTWTTPVYATFDMKPYYDNGMACFIKSREDRREKMRERGLHEAHDTGDIKRKKDMLEESNERKRDKGNKRP